MTRDGFAAGFATGLAIVLIVIFAKPATAHYVYETGTVYDDGETCIQNRSEISHGSFDSGYMKVTNESLTQNFYNLNCGARKLKPAGYMANWADLYFWNIKIDAWSVCRSTGWVYNTEESREFYIDVDVLAGDPVCGPTYYGTVGYTYVLNGSWYGGSLWSGHHYVDGSGGA